MAFDPSIISQIPDFAPNPTKAKADAYKLSDMMDTNTLNKMKLSDIQQQQQDAQKFKAILKDSDLSTDKGTTEAAEKMTQAGLPDQAMKFIKDRQAIAGGALDIQKQKLDIAESQQTALVSTMDGVVRQVDSYKQSNPQATPAMLDAKAQELLTPAMDQLAQQRPDLVPAINQYKQSPGALTYQGVLSAEAATKSGLARLKEHRDEQKGDREEREQDVRQQQANTQAVQAATSAKREEAYERSVDSLVKQRNPGPLTDKEMALAVPAVMADPNRINDYIGSKANSRDIKKQVNEAMYDRMEKAGIKPEDLTAIRASAKAEFNSIGKMTGQIDQMESFEGLAKFNGKRLLELVDELDDTSIPLLEGPIRMAKQKGAGSPDAKEFGMVLQSFQTEAARILNTPNMTGVLTEGARTDMQHIIDGSVTASQAHRIVDRAVAEMDVRKALFDKQIETAKKKLTPAFGPGTPPAGETAAPTAATQPAAVAPPAASAAAPPQAQAYDPNKPGVGLWK